jgi:hypothetical protein
VSSKNKTRTEIYERAVQFIDTASQHSTTLRITIPRMTTLIAKTYSITSESMSTLSIMTLNVKILSIATDSIMAFGTIPLGVLTLSMMTLYIMTHPKKGLIVTHNNTWITARHIIKLCIVVVNVIMLIVVILNVVAPLQQPV